MGHKFNQETFNRFILEKHIMGFLDKPRTLNSGRESNFYVNWRTYVVSDVYHTAILAMFVETFARSIGLEPDCFYGVPEGATKLALKATEICAEKSPDYCPNSHVLPMGRGKPKEHGDPADKYFVCAPRGKTILLEDTTTTGKSLLKSIDQLEEINCEIIGVICLTDRDQVDENGTSVEELVTGRGYKYGAMSHALQILPEAYKIYKPGKDIGRAVEKEFENYGLRPMHLI